MSSINFDNVYLLFLAIPLIVLLAVPYVIAVRKNNLSGHNIASMALHVVMAILIAFTAAGTKIVTVVTETDVYVVADVSYSAERNLDTVDNYIEQLGNDLPLNSRMGVICFGKDYKLLTRLGERRKSVKEANVDDSETNIVAALDYAGSLFRDGVIKRIVLITDGRETDQRDSGALRRAVDGLASQGIHVDAIYLDDNISDAVAEVQISSVEFTSSAYLDHEEEAVVTLQSSRSLGATLTLYANGEEADNALVRLTPGANTVTFPLDTSAVGSIAYEVRVAAEGDSNPFNNSYSFTQTVSGEVEVLLITNRTSDYAEVSRIVGERANITAYVNDPAVPCSIEELCRYDEIVLSNVDVSMLDNSALFMESLDTVVSLFGKTLLTLGDTSIQSKTEGELKPLADMLPVRFGNADTDEKLYTIVIDSSKSMIESEKLDIAKRAAIQLVDLLAAGDSVCVVKFHGDVETVQTVTRVDDSNRQTIKENIRNITGKHGTNIGLGLNQALTLIKDKVSNYSQSRLVLISDGLNMADAGGVADPLEIVMELDAYGIASSVIDVVNRETNKDEAAKRAEKLLQDIAAFGSGSYFAAPTMEALEEYVFAESATEMREDKVEGPTFVTVKRRSDDVVENIENFAYVRGFMNNAAKASATTVLTVDYQNAKGVTIDVPLYSYWNYGNGRVASYTSDFGSDWNTPWETRGIDVAFFGNVLLVNTPPEKTDYPFTVERETTSGSTLVTLTPASIRTDAVAKAQVTAPDGTVTELDLLFDATDYSRQFDTRQVGRYTVTLTYRYGEREFVADASFNVSYAPEYDSFAVFDASVLHKAIGVNGVVSEDGKLAIVNDESEYGTRTISLVVPLLITVVVLFAVDIIVRKLKWNDIRSLFVKTGKKGGRK